jgi:hypothetical protein
VIFPVGKPLFNIFGLSYLHWVWNILGSSLITVYEDLGQTVKNSDAQNNIWGIGIYLAVIIYGLLGIISRVIVVAGVTVNQLGLAIGISGCLAVWLAEINLTLNSSPQAEREVSSSTNIPSLTFIWERLGGILLFLGRSESGINKSWQAITVISGYSLWAYSRCLGKYIFKIDLLAFLIIWLQPSWLDCQLVPGKLQKLIINISANVTNAQNQNFVLLSLALFTYLVLMVTLTNSLHRANKPIW